MIDKIIIKVNPKIVKKNSTDVRNFGEEFSKRSGIDLIIDEALAIIPTSTHSATY